jgi:hypothetical protein
MPQGLAGPRHRLRAKAMRLQHVQVEIRPDPNTVYQISPRLPLSSQQIPFQAVGAGVTTVTYRLDGVTLGTVSGAPFQFWWTLAAGRHTLVAEGQSARSAPVEFEVLP